MVFLKSSIFSFNNIFNVYEVFFTCTVAEEAITVSDLSGNGVLGGYVSPCGCWELDPGLLQE